MWNPHPKWWYTLISSVNVNPVGRSGAWLGSHAQEEGFTCRWCVFPVQNCCPSEVLEVSLAPELALPLFWGLTQRGREHAQWFSFLPFVFQCWPGLLSFLTTALGFLALLPFLPCECLLPRGWYSCRLTSSCCPFSPLFPEGCKIYSLPNLGFSF